MLTYNEPLFRPPSEAYSLIFQLTHGCSWNKCAFCEMYTSKKFKVREEEEVFSEIDSFEGSTSIRKVFLADGNAFVLSFDRLMRVLQKLNENLPKLMRVSAYASSRDILSKTDEELLQLREAGLKLLYVGIESGDDELLKIIQKGEDFNSTKEALLRARKAGMKLSVMILNGLGGKKFSQQHALNSAKLINAIQPEFLSTLVLSFPYGVEHFKQKFKDDYIGMEPFELIHELGVFIHKLELDSCVYRSDHASNYLVLKGILNRDKQELLNRIKHVLDHQQDESLRPEWLRGL